MSCPIACPAGLLSRTQIPDANPQLVSAGRGLVAPD